MGNECMVYAEVPLHYYCDEEWDWIESDKNNGLGIFCLSLLGQHHQSNKETHYVGDRFRFRFVGRIWCGWLV